jgi:hypothetical protein
MSVAEIRTSVRVRPTDPRASCAVTTDPRTGAVSLRGADAGAGKDDVFHYPSSVVVGSDQAVAYDALCAPLVKRALAGYDCTLVAYGQTGSGKTHTMFGPAGCLVEAEVTRWRASGTSSAASSSAASSSSSSAPLEWGVFPRAALELMRTPGVRSIRASAVEVYHENVFDLMNGREQLSLGSSKTKFGRRVRGDAESGSDDVAGNRGGQGGVHPSCCTCHACFQLQERDKARAAAERAAVRERKKPAAAVSGRARLRDGGASGGAAGARSSRGAASGSAAAAARETFTAVGETFVTLDTPEALARFARSVEATRTSKAHLLNDRSSRSHCLVRLRFKRDGGGAGDGGARSSAQSRSLLFVDLAGSERVARTGAAGDARDEARAINGSLSALGRVIKTLGERRRRGRTSDAFSHVPYRDASLTMLLRDAFGGGSCTSVVIAVAGEREHAEETLCSLRFGERMAVVRNEPTRVVGNVSYAGDASVHEEAPKRFLRLRSALASATEELEALALRGDAGGFVEGGPVTEIRSLRSGMERLRALDAESAGLRARLAEALRGGGGGEGVGAATDAASVARRSASLRSALASSVRKAEVLRSVVERQKTIKAIWAEPTPSYARKAAEVRQIRSELEMEES